MNIDDPRANKSRRALLDAGIELLTRNPTASLSEIAQHAQVGRATLYRHFQTREQLIQALAEESWQIADQALEPLRQQKLTGRAAIEASIRVMMPLADYFHFLLSLWNIAYEDAQVMALYERQLAELTVLVEQGKREGSINPALSTEWLVVLIDTLLYASWWMMRTQAFSPEQAAEHAITALFEGIQMPNVGVS